jgi:subtilase family serine protease
MEPDAALFVGFQGTRRFWFSLRLAVPNCKFSNFDHPRRRARRSRRLFQAKVIPGGQVNKVKEANKAATAIRRGQTIWLYVILATLIAGVTLPASAAGTIAHNTPRYVSSAKNIGTVDPSKTIDVSIWLNVHNRAEMDKLAQQLYDRTSPNYRHFLNRAQFAARFAPSAAEAKTVHDFFESHNLHVVTIGPDNMFVRARGTVADVQTAFHVVLNNYQVAGKTIRSNDRDPFIDDPAAELVSTVSGLDSGEFQHPAVARTANLSAGPAVAKAPQGTLDGLGYSNVCFDGTEKESFSTNGDGQLPVGTYFGNHLNMFTLTTNGCGYDPLMIQAAYNLTGLYGEGFNGAGQTIGIIDWCGSPTIQNDANAFSAEFGLPALTSSNFTITYIPTLSDCISADSTEINIDVEWSHAVAPGANINLIVPPSGLFIDIDQAEYIAIDEGLATVLSGSYGSEEIYVASTELQNGSLLSELASIFGISTNFSSGDDGNYSFGYGYTPSVSYPADSPYATAVGGVTLSLNADNSIAWQAGWGNSQTLLAEEGEVFDPPLAFGFTGGSGGGESTCAYQNENVCVAGFAKPAFQKGIAGKYRQVPDISWLADPYTGAVIAITVPGESPALVWQVWGGTSVACPMFSGLWAIANQEAGYPLGQAAAYVYSLPAGAVYDILPVGSKTNVVAAIQEPTGTNKYSADEVAGVTGGIFLSTIWDYPDYQDTALAEVFGTNPGLKTGPGWDNETGVGTPNAQAFADSFAPTAKK